MRIVRKIKNIVLVGLLSPVNFDKYFFIKNQIFTEADILPNSLFGGIASGSIIQTVKQQLIINNNQLIINSLEPMSDDNEIYKTASKIVQSDSISDLQGLGINFHWFSDDNDIVLPQLTRQLFSNSDNKALQFFEQPNSSFGFYASKDFNSSRLKFDVKPNKLIENLETKDVISFQFNFHFDIFPTTGKEKVLEYIDDYKSFVDESNTIISIYQ